MTVTDLANLTNQSKQNLHSKMRRDNFSEDDLRKISEALGIELEINFILKNGDKI